MLHKENQQLRLLNEFAGEIGLSHNPREIMEKTLDLLQEHIRAEEAFFVIDYRGEYQRYSRESAPRTTSREHRKALTRLVLKSMRENPEIHTVDVDKADVLTNVNNLPLPKVVIAPCEHEEIIYGAMVILVEKDLEPAELEFLGRLVRQTRGFLFHALTFSEERDYLLLKQDIRVASEIQRQLLPKKTPRLEGFDIYGKTVSSHTVGGDYYDFISGGKGRLNLCIGDATGKGIPAALIMANLQATIRSLLLSDKPVQEYQYLANELLFKSTEVKKYASLFLGMLDAKSKTLRYSNAGHNPPLVIAASGETMKLRAGGVPLGIISAVHYQEETVYLNEGDTVFLYSDGILEAVNARDEDAALAELEDLVRRHSDDSAEDLVERILEFATNRGENGLIKDDMTVIIVQRKE